MQRKTRDKTCPSKFLSKFGFPPWARSWNWDLPGIGACLESGALLLIPLFLITRPEEENIRVREFSGGTWTRNLDKFYHVFSSCKATCPSSPAELGQGTWTTAGCLVIIYMGPGWNRTRTTWLRSLRLSHCAMAALLFSDTVCLTCPPGGVWRQSLRTKIRNFSNTIFPCFETSDLVCIG